MAHFPHCSPRREKSPEILGSKTFFSWNKQVGWGWEIMTIMKKGTSLKWSWISLSIHSILHKINFLCQWNFFLSSAVSGGERCFVFCDKLSFSYTGFFEKSRCGLRYCFLEHSPSCKEWDRYGWLNPCSWANTWRLNVLEVSINRFHALRGNSWMVAKMCNYC